MIKRWPRKKSEWTDQMALEKIFKLIGNTKDHLKKKRKKQDYQHSLA